MDEMMLFHLTSTATSRHDVVPLMKLKGKVY